MNEISEKDKIENMIYEIRGVQVMLDSDLARIYECANGTKTINLAVKRHFKRFPERFMFQLTNEECNRLSRFQLETLKGLGHNIKYLPYAFTEQGVAMLATVLRTKVAEEVSIRIMDAFVKMRHFIKDNNDVFKSINHLNNKIIEHDEKIDYLFSKFDSKEKLFLKGEVFTSYVSIMEIISLVKNELIIIDEYADITFLDLIRNTRCNILLITKDSDRLSNIEIEKYNKEYHNLRVIRNNDFHDRFIIVDRKDFYLFGASLNNMGGKTSMIIKIENVLVKQVLLNQVQYLYDN